MPKCVTSLRDQFLCHCACGQHSSFRRGMPQWWQAVGSTVSDFSSQSFEPQTCRFRCERVTAGLTGWFIPIHYKILSCFFLLFPPLHENFGISAPRLSSNLSRFSTIISVRFGRTPKRFYTRFSMQLLHATKKILFKILSLSASVKACRQLDNRK